MILSLKINLDAHDNNVSNGFGPIRLVISKTITKIIPCANPWNQSGRFKFVCNQSKSPPKRKYEATMIVAVHPKESRFFITASHHVNRHRLNFTAHVDVGDSLRFEVHFGFGAGVGFCVEDDIAT